MPFQFQFRRYRLPLRTTIRTAHEVWTERTGLVIRIELNDGRTGYGEVAPIPAFGTETVEQATEACSALGEWPTGVQLQSIPRGLVCLRSAVSSALAELRDEESLGGTPGASEVPYRSVAALLPAGRAAIEILKTQAEAGFRVFKWKVGVGDLADELTQLDDLCGAMPSGAKLRLDANGAWDRRQAERWLERCAERPIEFVEQPCFARAVDGTAALKRAEDMLTGLASDFPTPIALDESVVSDGDVTRWIGNGWPGWYVLKPTLLGDVEAAVQQLAQAKASVVFSSALETAVGARSALRTAFAWQGRTSALGFGVWPLFRDSSFNGPAAAPFIRAQDVNRLSPETVWNALP